MRALPLVGLFAVASAVSACSSSTEPSSVAGDYRLETINGASLPYTIVESDSYKDEIMASTLKLAGDGSAGTYTLSFVVRETYYGVVAGASSVGTGTWILTGDAFVLRPDDGGSLSGTLTGKTLSLTQEGFAFVYKR